MKLSLNLIAIAASAALLMVAGPAMAQPENGSNLFDLNGDVDRDGMVGSTDVQHVINRALGLETEDPNRPERPVRRYVVASPRAALLPVKDDPSTDAADPCPCPVIGRAHNFPRQDGRIMVRQGSEVAFVMDHHIEGVWYPGACGVLSSQMGLEIARDPGNLTVQPEWTPIGRDGARGERCGPRVGTARIGVKHRFQQAGDFLIRARIQTRAVPGPAIQDRTEGEVEGEQTSPPEIEPCGAARDFSEVIVKVRVVSAVPTEDEVREFQDIPEDVMRRDGFEIPRELEDIIPSPRNN